jgi:hypothetical protein
LIATVREKPAAPQQTTDVDRRHATGRDPVVDDITADEAAF